MEKKCDEHQDHPHQHGPACGHTLVKHDGHTDYLHGGHLHHPHEGHVDEHVIAVTPENPAVCQAIVKPHYAHGPECGHEQIPHGNHVDFVVDGRLHHLHGAHCDDHGPVETEPN